MGRKRVPDEGKKHKFNKMGRKMFRAKRYDSLSHAIKQLKIEKQVSGGKSKIDFGMINEESEFLQKIDHHSFIGCFFAYGLFNCIYWIDMLFY